jgi:3-hydroxyacyl-CoA dehydrogenase/enoyl-CoA hydratase/3-hydroxybutyryl-CoA epimerase
LKRQVFAEIEPVVAGDALLGSNTSTLPITGLAAGVHRRSDFLGLHFFSPVDRMPLLEIVRGEHTSDEAVARAVDFAARIRKTPIVVNDSRGFFTSRVIGTFVNEALAMLAEGIPPATIEQAATQAGYPVGALQLADELNLELFARIRTEARAAVGRQRHPAGGAADAYRPHPAEDVVDKMLELGRPGRLRNAGFYDYDSAGTRLGLWSGLGDVFPVTVDPRSVELRELSERMLVIEAVESARCVEEGVIRQTADANIGSIMGIGYPAWTGGVLQYMNGYPGGLAAFVARADELAKRYGERFAPNPLVRKKADNGETF